MATTPINALPYPATSDSPNGPLQIQNLATALDSRVNPRFATTAARDTAIPSPIEGQICFINAQTSPNLPARQLLYAVGAWRLVGPSPLQPVASAFTEPAGSFGTSPTTVTSVTVPYPGFPFTIAALSRVELGSTAVGTRWDTQILAKNTDGTGVDTLIDQCEGVDGQITYQRMSQAGPNGRVFDRAVTVRLQAVAAFGSALGTVNAGGNRAFAVWVYGI